MNLFRILEQAARKWPEETAVVHNGRSFRYVELYTAAESVAERLRQSGIRPGGKIGVTCQTSAEYIIAFLAVLQAGGIIVPLSPALKLPEVEAIGIELGLDAFCYGKELRAIIPEPSLKHSKQILVFDGRSPWFVGPGVGQRTAPANDRDQLLALDAASIGFSSGTTSKAKGIILSHRCLCERATIRLPTGPFTKSRGILWLRPMDPFPYQICGCFLAGAKVLLADSLALEPLPGLLAEHRVEQVYASPLFYRTVNQGLLTQEDLGGVMYFVSAGSALPGTVADRFRTKFDREITQLYGLTECAPVLLNISDDKTKRGSIGQPVSDREIKLAPLDGDSAEGEEVGEILIRGPGLFDGYYRPWRPRDEVLEDGWLRTGDLARRDKDGYYWIVGRTKAMINVGGVKVSPYEVEEILSAHPAVEEAVVYGKAEPRFGEVPHARVKLRPGASCREQELLRYVNDRLSVFKALRAVEFVDELLKTARGKLKRATAIS